MLPRPGGRRGAGGADGASIGQCTASPGKLRRVDILSAAPRDQLAWVRGKPSPMSSGPPRKSPPAAPFSSQEDERALENVRRQLSAAVKRICPPWLSASRDDIVQTALIRVYNLGGENREGFSASYLWKVAFSVTMDEIRRQRRRPEEGLDSVATTDVTQASPDPEERALGRELGRIIRECLGELGEDRRLAVTLHLQGHTVAEASVLLGWPGKRVANLTYRGLEDLRGCLSARGIEL